MAVSTKTLIRLIMLKRAGLFGVGSRMLELGHQTVRNTTGETLRDFISEFCGAPCVVGMPELDIMGNGCTMASLMRLCGVSYLALDVFEAEDCMAFDLNTDTVPHDLVGKFDIVTNFGTSEHVLNQYNIFSVMHDFAAIGGLMYHDVPMGGYYYHGYFAYTPLLFNNLINANSYQPVFKWFSKAPHSSPMSNPSPGELIENGWPDESGYHDVGIEFIFQKTQGAGFRVPVDVHTGGNFDRAFIESKRSNAVILGNP